MKTIKKLDTVIINESHTCTFSSKIGFVIEIYPSTTEDEFRYDVQFPFEQVEGDDEKTEDNRITQQMQFGRDNMSLIQSY